MKPSHRSPFLALLALAACARAMPPSPVAPAVEGAGGLPNDAWVGVYFRSFDRVAEAAGIPPLRAQPLPPGEREVRVWIGGGLGYPQQLYRVVDRQGRVRGEEVRYWPLDDEPTFADGHTFDELVAANQRGACEAVRRTARMAACRARFTRPPDWAGVLRRAEASRLWSLPDESTLGNQSIILDGTSVTVELRSGAEYRAWQYDLRPIPRGPESAAALEIARAFRGVDSLVHRPDVLRVYRGVTSGRYGSAFRPCGGSEDWEFRESLPSLAARTGMPAPDSAAGARHYVAVRAILAPEWLARQWRSAYPRVLQVQELVETRPWTGRECSGASGR